MGSNALNRQISCIVSLQTMSPSLCPSVRTYVGMAINGSYVGNPYLSPTHGSPPSNGYLPIPSSSANYSETLGSSYSPPSGISPTAASATNNSTNPPNGFSQVRALVGRVCIHVREIEVAGHVTCQVTKGLGQVTKGLGQVTKGLGQVTKWLGQVTKGLLA